ncbi:RelA/SpoT family protein [Dethiosulfatarculus sandiegensis]|uniref:GTP pyrophosphokinase n=1 Tax=Dethiosulfatarculus sandiegensis TaxID=1429043 RepID=A0A0D2JCW3_9BACT|nr:bifunctional (p)ppGpp synthetase/guanosine-3',5'-bis(diphosphate) 3'-pyrophosphohydrolase [Dethiosulfatarculus sandiegensis]KIX13596.1 GTP pyrophosphokinase [Dethiosulfatarculus sandiegensis]
MRINEIIDRVKTYHPGADDKAIMKAYVYSAKLHAGQTRRSGEPYLSHPLAVAGLLAEMRLDVASICAGLLHDTVEDTSATREDIKQLLGEEVAYLVDGVTKITMLRGATQTSRQAATLRKMVLAMADDIRVLLIKLADRLHNMRTLGFMPPAKQKSIATETRDIYAPMAHRLGIRRWQAELEDLSLYYLEPDAYQYIKQGVATKQSDRQAFTTDVKDRIRKAMAKHGIECNVSGRPKHFSSIYLKMKRRNVDIDELYDLIAFRVIVTQLKDCYEALMVVHNLWKPIPGRFRDYIGMPKSNMYQSLHTSVVGPLGQRMEVQIRTEAMHRVAEEGIAAHWRYKEQGSGEMAEQDRFSWLRRLMEGVRETEDPSEIINSLRMDLYPEAIFVFTPNGEVKELPRGATPVDFAYSIHTEVGHQCVGAKVNGRMVPLRTELQTGDQVSIDTQVNHHPSKDWLKYVVSGRAKSKIRSYIRESERAGAINLGKDLLDRQLRKVHLTLHKVTKGGDLQKVAKDLSFPDPDLLLAAIAYGKVSPRMVANRIQPPPEHERKPGLLERSFTKLRKRPAGGIKVKGLDDILVRFAKCCNPLPGDPIAGFITRGKGVTVHNKNCPHLANADPERVVDVQWNVDQDQVHPVWVQVESNDRAGILADVTAVLKKHSVNIAEAQVQVSEANKRGVTNFRLQVHDTTQLQKVFKDIKRVKGVVQIKRMGTIRL